MKVLKKFTIASLIIGYGVLSVGPDPIEYKPIPGYWFENGMIHGDYQAYLADMREEEADYDTTADLLRELPLCPKGTLGEQPNCILDPMDCSRPEDESNQESCYDSY